MHTADEIGDLYTNPDAAFIAASRALVPALARALLAALDELEAAKTPCIWRYDDYDCTYITGCGKYWQFEDGTAEENDCHFCHNCGHPVQVVMPETDPYAEEL